MLRVIAAGVTAVATERLLLSSAPGGATRWKRRNHRGSTVSLLSGPALVLAASTTARLPVGAALLAGLGAGVVGGYDDAVGGAGARGLRGHLRALAQGQLTTGSVKIVGLATAGLTCAARLPHHRTADLLVGGAVVAGTANLLNLLDLRPGRALKVGTLWAAGLGQPGIAAACAALLPGDLRERTMLGDAGANALGALLGAATVQRLGVPGRLVTLAGLVALTGASEVVSYSAVIDRTRPLRWLDRLGQLA